jgi:uncharacterized protein (TIGR03437 family)
MSWRLDWFHSEDSKMKRLLLAASAVGFLLPVIASGQIGNIVVTSGASFQPGLPPKGSIGTIFCTGLRVSGIVGASGTPLPTSLAGVTVTVGGVAAPLFAVADLGGYQQINFQVPVPDSGVLPFEGTQVTVAQSGAQGSTTVKASPSPGDFFRIPGTQYGIFQHAADYSLVTPDNPARAGEIIIAYATGLRPARPEVPLGQPAPLSPLSIVPQLDIGTAVDQIGLSVNYGILLMDEAPESGDTTGQLPIPFMGLGPGQVGVYQINFVFPEGVRPLGNVPILLVRKTCGGPGFSCVFPRYSNGEPVLIPVR